MILVPMITNDKNLNGPDTNLSLQFICSVLFWDQKIK